MVIAVLDVPLDQARWAASNQSRGGYVREHMDLLLQGGRSQALEHAIQLILTQTDSPDAGLSALLCVSIKGLTYLILNDRRTVPSRSGFQQVSSRFDWNDEFNKKQESRINQGMQCASGKSNEAEADAKDFRSMANQASQSADGGVDKGAGNDNQL